MKKTAKLVFWLLLVIIILLVCFILIFNSKYLNMLSDIFYDQIQEKSPSKLKIEKIVVKSDKDGDGILDLDDILQGARKDAKNKSKYRNAYYQGGYPPDNEGVCTDVIWRAFKNAGYDLKSMVDKDISENVKDYAGVNGEPDPNIDFRRVKNLNVFFKKYGENLTLELKPNDLKNLEQWQAGDIVTFGTTQKKEHIAIISDKRRSDGIPYIIHNSGPYTREADDLMHWYPYIIGHYRYPKKAVTLNN